MLTACWQAERQAPAVTVLTSDLWQEQDAPARDLVVLGPVRDGKLRNVLRSLDPSSAAILCVPAEGSSERRSEEHTSELQSLTNLVCRLLLEKKKKKNK